MSLFVCKACIEHVHTTHTHMHTKQSLWLLLSGHANPVKHWGAWALLRPVLVNPPGRGLVPCPRVMVWAPKVPPGPHPLVQDMDSSLTFASPGTY